MVHKEQYHIMVGEPLLHNTQERRERPIPFFSIILPVYNVAPYLQTCLNSLLAQTYLNWECLCVDDGSTDTSGAILDKYAQKDSRFRVFHKINKGVSTARNLALEHARGAWIWCVDGDDAIHVEALAWLHGVINQFPQVNSIAFNVSFAKDLESISWESLPTAQTLSLSQKVTSHTLSAHRRAGCAVVFRKTSLRFSSHILGEDILFLFSNYWENPCCVITEVPLYFYRQREGSIVHSKVTLQKVNDFFETEIKLAQLFITHSEKWNPLDCLEYLRWNRNFVWFTFRLIFNDLPWTEMKKMIPLWCRVQELQFSLLPETLKRRTIWWIIHKTNSPFLCKILIFWKATKKRLLHR
jgi:glycosyltransferase involved in cell wall biosynthesis